MVKTKTDGCQKYDSKTILVNIPIPPIPPTDLSTSNIIKVRFCVRVCIDLIYLKSRNEIIWIINYKILLNRLSV